MTPRQHGERGMSLVEATIVLMVIATLTAVISPSMRDYIDDSRQTKAKEDVEAIGTAITRLLRDTGTGCLSDAPPACTLAARVDLLVSSGLDPTATGAAYAPPSASTVEGNANSNWIGGTDAVAAGRQDDMYDQLMTNVAGYTSVSFTTGSAPRGGIGWRGAYVSGNVGPDPWGRKYQANTMFLLQATDAGAGTTNGLVSGGWINDTLVVSAGPDGIIQTIFALDSASGTTPARDDVVYVVAGSSR